MFIFYIFVLAKILKKSIFIFVGIVIVVFMTCHFFIYNLSVYAHKNEVQKKLDCYFGKTEKIEISASKLFKNSEEIQWFENNTEIKYYNEPYDVVSISIESDKVILSVIDDNTERSMYEEFQGQSDVIFEKNQAQNNGHKLISGFLSLKCIFTTPLNFSSTISTTVFLKEASFSVCLGYLTVQTPPPNNLV